MFVSSVGYILFTSRSPEDFFERGRADFPIGRPGICRHASAGSAALTRTHYTYFHCGRDYFVMGLIRLDIHSLSLLLQSQTRACYRYPIYCWLAKTPTRVWTDRWLTDRRRRLFINFHPQMDDFLSGVRLTRNRSKSIVDLTD